MIPFPPKKAYELSKECKSQLRARLFMQLEGIPLIPTLAQLAQSGILHSLASKEEISLVEEASRLQANEGYLNVALRLLCSQGYAYQVVDPTGEDRRYSATELGLQIFQNTSTFIDLGKWINLATEFKELAKEPMTSQIVEVTNTAMGHLCDLRERSKRERKENTRALTHIEGVLVGPVLVYMAMNELLDDISVDDPSIDLTSPELHPDWQMWITELFCQLGWITQQESSTFVTPEGMFFFKRANAYGVTVSYMKTFGWLDELLFGKADKLWDNPNSKHEIHVDRKMNVWGSGGAHSTYFSKIDKIVLEIFNLPLDQQPKGIVDMGCGNGALLIHLYDLISKKTLRGKHLDSHPVRIIGADLNQAALDVTSLNLEAAKVEGFVLKGDIGDPQKLAESLKSLFDLDLHEMLSVRSFLDHNRIYKRPEKISKDRIGRSTGAFTFRGRRIPNFELEQELHDHFSSWKPYVAKFGLLVIELHTVDPALASCNIGRTAITAYDGTHGYTDQYIVEYPVFIDILQEVGLKVQPGTAHAFPSFDLTTVSIQLLKGMNAD